MFFGFVMFVVFIPNVNNHYVFTEQQIGPLESYCASLFVPLTVLKVQL